MKDQTRRQLHRQRTIPEKPLWVTAAEKGKEERSSVAIKKSAGLAPGLAGLAVQRHGTLPK
eukprot:10405463-Heterocapsa_arctica.AAC.1